MGGGERVFLRKKSLRQSCASWEHRESAPSKDKYIGVTQKMLFEPNRKQKNKLKKQKEKITKGNKLFFYKYILEFMLGSVCLLIFNPGTKAL